MQHPDDMFCNEELNKVDVWNDVYSEIRRVNMIRKVRKSATAIVLVCIMALLFVPTTQASIFGVLKQFGMVSFDGGGNEVPAEEITDELRSVTLPAPLSAAEVQARLPFPLYDIDFQADMHKAGYTIIDGAYACTDKRDCEKPAKVLIRYSINENSAEQLTIEYSDNPDAINYHIPEYMLVEITVQGQPGLYARGIHSDNGWDSRLPYQHLSWFNGTITVYMLYSGNTYSQHDLINIAESLHRIDNQP